MILKSLAMITFCFYCLSLAVHGRYVKSPDRQGTHVQATATVNTAFVTSGPISPTAPTRKQSRVSDQRLSIPLVNLYSALAARANIPRMGDDDKDDKERSGPPGLFDKAVKLGKKKSEEKGGKMFVKGIISGCHIALGSMLAVSYGVFRASGIDIGLQKILLGMFGLPMALLMTLTAGGELVTGNFGFLAAAFFEGKIKLGKAWSNWVNVWGGNLLGTLLIAWIAFQACTGFGEAARALAIAKITAPFGTLVAKGILCNWLVCTAMWMATSTPDMVSKAVSVFFPVSGFVALGFEHCVANMFLITFGMYHGADISTFDMFFKNLLPVTLGNLIGGAWGVAFLYKVAYGSDVAEKKKKEKKKKEEKKKEEADSFEKRQIEFDDDKKKKDKDKD